MLSFLIPYTLLPTGEYDRIVETLGVLGLDTSSTPESARARVEALRAEGKAEAHRERLEAMAAEDLAAEREALAKTLDGKAPTETRADIGIDDIRLMAARALGEPTAPTSDPNDVVRLVRRLVEAHSATKTTLWQSAAACAQALLTDMGRARTDPDGVIREAAVMAAQGRCALGVLEEIDALREGKAKPTEASMAAYRGGARSAQREGRALAAAADRAMALVQLLMLSLHGRDEQAAKDRAEDHKVIEMHQGIANELAAIINAAQDQLDRLGVPRLPAPLDKYIWLRIQVMAAMRERIVLGVDHGAGPDKSAWTVWSVK